ncbi:MAG: hypothetical protein WDO73_20710 [Ignavibacteriota bacterium]
MALLMVLLGVAIRLGWLAVGFWKLRLYRRHSMPLEPAPTWGVEASLLVSDEIASPVTFGWLFHGGTNPTGWNPALQESQATGYPNDLPLKAYDFQAPLGEYGQMHPSFRELKSIHLFLEDFGPSLAPMAAFFPPKMPAGKDDTETPRLAVRADAKGGFIFLNNYQKDHPLPSHANFQVEVKLPTETVDVPRHPVELPGGAYTYWPVNLPVGSATLVYATAQPLCKLDDPDTTVFFAWPGIAPEFAFRVADGVTIEAPGGKVERANGTVYITGLQPGLASAIRIRTAKGHASEILLLTREQARNIWKAPLAGRDRLVFSNADLYFEGDRIHLGSTDPSALAFGLYPGLECKIDGFQCAGKDGIFQRYATKVEAVAVEAKVVKLADPKAAPSVKIAAEVALAPSESAFEAAARWSIRVPEIKSAGVSEVLLRIAYQGDVARLYAGSRLITDDFYHGTPWEIGLRRIPADELERGLALEILPLRQDSPIYLAAGARPTLPDGGQVAKLLQIQVITQYQAIAEVKPGNPTFGGFH